MSMIHPTGWRNVDGQFKNIQNILKSKQILYLEMHGYKDGLKVFGAQTDFDFYCLKNIINNGHLTKIKYQNGNIENIDLSKMEFISNGLISEIQKILAKDNEERVELFHNCFYHTQRYFMSKEKNEQNIYPCIQNINIKNEISCMWYSNTNNKGHFGIPKVIFGRKLSGVLIDKNGEYGMCQDCSAIIDSPENFENIKKALESEKFIRQIMGFEIQGDKYNRKIISLFRKDFWKEFV